MSSQPQYAGPKQHPRIAFVVYNSMHHDTRVLREAQAAIAAGAVVRVFAFGGESVSYYPAGVVHIDGVEVERVRITTIRRWLVIAGQVLRRLLRRGATPAPTSESPADAGPAATVPAAPPVADPPAADSTQGLKSWVIRQWLRADLTVRQWSFWRAATRAVRAWEPDLVHAHDANALPVAGRLWRAASVPFVYDSHELWTRRNVSADRPVAKRLEGPMERWWARRAAAVVTVSPSIAAWLKDHYRLRELPTLVRNIPPLAASVPAREEGRLRALAHLGPDTSVIAYCGGITTNRGIERGIEALPHLPATVHMVLLGTGSEVYYAELRALAASLGVADRVHLVGAVASDEVSAALADADVSIVLTRPAVLSYAFSLPNKLFESLHAGVPVVVSDTPDAASLVRRHGVGVVAADSDGPTELAATIAGVLSDRERFRAAGAEAARSLNWQQEAAALIAVHSAVLTAAGRRRPAWARRVLWAAIGACPEWLQMRLTPAKYGFTAQDVPAPVVAPQTDIRLYIAPVNSAGQGYRWARAAEALPGVGAVNMQHRTDRDFGFPADYALPTLVFVRSLRWQRAQFRAVSRGFTHVMIESARPQFAGVFGGSVEREVDALRRAGVKVAMVFHGSDLRLPSRHAATHEWSPFRSGEWDRTPDLEVQAIEAQRVLAAIQAPVFVSTPDLLVDCVDARWLPTVVDVEQWRCAEPALQREVPVVVHVPSNPVVKGSDLIDDAVQRLAAEGLIEYRRIRGVAASEMPAIYAEADVVLDQFRLASYGVAALEGMAAGRVVVGDVGTQARDHVRAAYGREIPIVQANPSTIESVLRDIVSDRERYRALAVEGTEFVTAIHDGRAAAAVLAEFLGG